MTTTGYIDATRRRTTELYRVVATDPRIPTPLVDLVQVLIHRLNDLEEEQGYKPPLEPGVSNKVDTQGR